MGNIFSTDTCDQFAQNLLPLMCGKWKCMYLEANLEALQKGKQDLNEMRNDLLKRVSKEEERGRQVLLEVKEWIEMVKQIEPKVNRLLDVSVSEIRRLSIDGYCSQNYASSTYDYNQCVVTTLKDVEALRSKGVFEVVIDRAIPPPVVDRPQIQLTVSQKKLLEEAWDSLMDNNVGTMVIYGRGGIGKTVLLTQIKRKFLDNEAAFGLLIFVVVASEEVESVQEEISKRLGLQWGTETQREKADGILRVLKRKRFVLLVDGIQRELDLEEIGVPFPRNGCKIVFTTRYQDLCKSKWVDANVEVKCLSPEESWDLFQKTVGESKLRSHQDIPKLARVVASTCRGLPLALDLIGATMSCKSTVREWRYTIHVLALSTAQFPDMVDEFLPILKSIYDNMSGEKMRLCFLYCALFPKNCDLKKEDLVEYWISEGIITKKDKEIAEMQGYEMIDDLVMMRLLVEDEYGYCVKMHGMVREMAMWIASGFGRHKENLVMVGGKRIKEMPVIKDPRMDRRLSVTSTQIENIPNSPDCSHLTTFSLQDSNHIRRPLSGGSWNSTFLGVANIVSAFGAIAEGSLLVCGSITGHADFISKFDDNLDDLKIALEDLKAKRADLAHKVNTEEIKGQLLLDEVGRWLSKAQTVVNDTNLLVSYASPIRERLSTHGFCNNNIILAYICGKKIPKMLREVREVFSEKVFQGVTRPATLRVIVEEPSQQTVGLDTKLDSTWSLLMDDGTRMLGLYGMGGVGKTTLLTRISNKLDEVKDKFEVVIWLKVSKGIIEIQDDISKRLSLYEYNWTEKNQREKASEILRVLKYKKPRFVLLLDDLWEVVSLSDIGIPLEGTEYKIVFTTRSKNVCQRMGGINIQVECLAKEDALDLLKKNARRDTLTGLMLRIAKKIVNKCCGLPLALEVIGKCLSSRTTEYEWNDVLHTLVYSPHLLEGMEDKMFGVLKIGYDYLEEEDAKLCFQYCALFPMGDKINQDKLIEYWIGEGIIDASSGRERAKIRGVQIINTLVGESLLMTDTEPNQKVHMHNMIREMALWMVSNVKDGKMFIVKTDAGLTELPFVTDWPIVSKMSLMNNHIKRIRDDPEIPYQARLKTLFLQNNRLVEIVGKFFMAMSTLVVLDLSGNFYLSKLPEEISVLVALRYLNLSRTRINSLPSGFGNLSELIHLDLEFTSNLRSIILVSGLLKLQVLRFYASAALDVYLLTNLEGLRDLQLLTITVNAFDVLKAFLGSNILRRCTQSLYLEGLELSGKSFAATFDELGSLSKLGMSNCHIKESETKWEENRSHQCPSPSNQITSNNTLFKNLSALLLRSCLALTDLTWLIYAVNLKSLCVLDSPKMKEVINEKKAANVEIEPFQKLQVLKLVQLTELESIYWSPLSLPSLQNVHITMCPKLRKLPLHSMSVVRIDDLRIQVDDGWLEGVEWESGAEERFRLAIHNTA